MPSASTMQLPRDMRWVQDVLADRVDLEQALALDIGAVLGCGGWGCVLDTNTPWVLKLTLDVREVAAWNWLDQFVRKCPAAAGGIARIGALAELEQRVYDSITKRVRPAFLVLREKVEPLPRERHRAGGFEDYGRFRARGWRDDQAAALVRMLDRYMEHTTKFARALLPWSKREHYERVLAVIQDIETLHDDAIPLAQSLYGLLRQHYLVGDLHVGNIGWRSATNIAGERLPSGLILIDPESLERRSEVPDLPVYRSSRGT